MDTREILEQLQKEQITLDQADHLLRRQPYEELGYAKLDMHRKVRSGCAEVIFVRGRQTIICFPFFTLV